MQKWMKNKKEEKTLLKMNMTRNFFIKLLGRAFEVMKNGVYFILIAFLVAGLFKIVLCKWDGLWRHKIDNEPISIGFRIKFYAKFYLHTI